MGPGFCVDDDCQRRPAGFPGPVAAAVAGPAPRENSSLPISFPPCRKSSRSDEDDPFRGGHESPPASPSFFRTSVEEDLLFFGAITMDSYDDGMLPPPAPPPHDVHGLSIVVSSSGLADAGDGLDRAKTLRITPKPAPGDRPALPVFRKHASNDSTASSSMPTPPLSPPPIINPRLSSMDNLRGAEGLVESPTREGGVIIDNVFREPTLPPPPEGPPPVRRPAPPEDWTSSASNLEGACTIEPLETTAIFDVLASDATEVPVSLAPGDGFARLPLSSPPRDSSKPLLTHSSSTPPQTPPRQAPRRIYVQPTAKMSTTSTYTPTPETGNPILFNYFSAASGKNVNGTADRQMAYPTPDQFINPQNFAPPHPMPVAGRSIRQSQTFPTTSTSQEYFPAMARIQSSDGHVARPLPSPAVRHSQATRLPPRTSFLAPRNFVPTGGGDIRMSMQYSQDSYLQNHSRAQSPQVPPQASFHDNRYVTPVQSRMLHPSMQQSPRQAENEPFGHVETLKTLKSEDTLIKNQALPANHAPYLVQDPAVLGAIMEESPPQSTVTLHERKSHPAPIAIPRPRPQSQLLSSSPQHQPFLGVNPAPPIPRSFDESATSRLSFYPDSGGLVADFRISKLMPGHPQQSLKGSIVAPTLDPYKRSSAPSSSTSPPAHPGAPQPPPSPTPPPPSIPPPPLSDNYDLSLGFDGREGVDEITSTLSRPTFRRYVTRRTGTAGRTSMLIKLRGNVQKATDSTSQTDATFRLATFCIESSGDVLEVEEREKLKEEGFRLLIRLGNHGMPEAQYYLGKAYAEDHELACPQFLRAARQNHPSASYAVGSCLENGKGCRMDLAAASTFYKAAAEQGHKLGMYRYGRALLNGELGTEKDVALGVEWLKKAADVADRLHPYPLFLLATIYEQGMEGIPPDYNYALAMLHEGVKYDHGPCLASLAKAHETGRLGAPISKKKAVDLYRRGAVEGDDAECQHALSDLYLKGVDGALPRNNEQALYWAEKSAEKGHAGSLFALGYFFEHGIGTIRNLETAAEFYTKAADAGELLAVSRLKQADMDRFRRRGDMPVPVEAPLARQRRRGRRDDDKCLIS
ncbi:hypothetical protein HK101_001083 [Irineochytrium annulatum]|nr:hypothetical protein HK101_001083 [Irineochytrium annulatum]